MKEKKSLLFARLFCTVILFTLLPLATIAAGGMSSGLEPGMQMINLDPNDAKTRTFERWSSSFINPDNYYYWHRARMDFNGDRPLFWASGLSIAEKRGKIVDTPEQGKVLRVKYPKGAYGSKDSGVSFPWILKGSYGEMNLSYRVKFQENFLFTTSGKLPGLCGATDTMGCFRYTGGNPPTGDDGFSVRIVWLNGDGRLGTYVYHANQSSKYGDIYEWKHADGSPVFIVPGQWHTLELYVRLNDPGVPNGVAEGWFDGEHVSLATDLLFRNDTQLGRSIWINEMYFSTFHGGNSKEHAPAQTQYAYFDDFNLFLFRAFESVDPIPTSAAKQADVD